MKRAGVVTAIVALAAHASCGSTTPAASACLIDEDCPVDWYCDGMATSAGVSCVPAPAGTCRPIDYSISGMACADDPDCTVPIFYCSAILHECAINVCLSSGNDPIVACAPRCRAGKRGGPCRACFCDSCAAPDGGADAQLP